MDLLLLDGVRLRVRSDGPPDAPAVLFSNSLGCDLSMWDAQVETLVDRYRTIRYDTRGHGASDVPPGDYTLPQLGRDLLAVLDHFGVARAVVCGISLGGITAQWLALEHPGRVAALLLANTASRVGSDETWAARIDAVRAGGMAAIRDAVLARFLSDAFRARNPDAAARLAQTIAATDPTGYLGCCAALRDADLSSTVAAIRAPTLIVGSGLDQSTPPAQAEALHAAIQGSELLVFPEAAHLSNLEEPARFAAALIDFVERRADLR